MFWDFFRRQDRRPLHRDGGLHVHAGEVTGYPYWMMGNEEAFITDMVCDLAKLQAGFVNSPDLDDELFTKVNGAPEWLEGVCSFMPGVAPLIAQHFMPCSVRCSGRVSAFWTPSADFSLSGAIRPPSQISLAATRESRSTTRSNSCLRTSGRSSSSSMRLMGRRTGADAWVTTS